MDDQQQADKQNAVAFFGVLALLAGPVVAIVGYASTQFGVFYLIAGLLVAEFGVLLLAFRLLWKAVAYLRSAAADTSQAAGQ